MSAIAEIVSSILLFFLVFGMSATVDVEKMKRQLRNRKALFIGVSWQFGKLTAAKGAIVNVTSIAGYRVHPFAGAAYATSKAALAALTREMAHDLGPRGIRVNAIAPGEIETEILSPGTEKLAEQIPLRRLGDPMEVAETIHFLCSDASSYISGTEIEINGGQHI